MAFVSNLLPHDKFKMFKTLFRYPVKTNEVTGVCFDKLSRILTVVTRRSIISSKTRNKGTIGNITAKTYYTNRKFGVQKDGSFSKPK